MIPGIALFFYRPLLFMGKRKKILNENNVHFIYQQFTFFCARSKLKYLKNFHEGSNDVLLFVLEIEFHCTQNFCKINSLQDGVEAKD